MTYGRQRILANDSAEKDELDIVGAEQLHRDVQAVGDDLQIFLVFDLARNLVRRGAGIENDGIAVVDHLGCRGADPSFLVGVKLGLDLERRIHAHGRRFDGATVRATDQTSIVERLEAVADRRLGGLEAFAQTANSDLPVLFQQFENFGSAFNVQHWDYERK